MGLRPAAAEWFEILTPREELTHALQCLASTGAVELQTHSQTTSHAQLPDLHEGLAVFGELSRRYGDWWPEPESQNIATFAEPAAQLTVALEALKAWEAEAKPVVDALQRGQRLKADLEMLREAIEAAGEDLPDLHQLAASGPYLAGRLYLLPVDAVIEQVPASVLLQPAFSPANRFLFAVGNREQIEMLDEYLTTLKARRLELPDWLPGAWQDALAIIDDKIKAAASEVSGHRKALAQIQQKHELASVLGRLRLLDWYVTHVPELPVTERFAWITGWTSDPGAGNVESCLRENGVDFLLRISEPPADVSAPMVLHNPPWARPFELFASLLGTPGAQDIDPSLIVALLAPLMFGYMFGDVGQGAVLLAIGLLYRRRMPVLALLVPGGIAAMVFGLLFGSVFGIEDLIPALWMHPLEHPIPILATSLAFGVFLVTLGLALDAHQCHWRGEDMAFWGARLGLSITYFGLLYAIVLLDSLGLWLAVLGTTWYIVGSAIRGRPNALPAAGAAVAEYLETVLQLLVNTISFVRVGAFALAHAGLSTAMIGIADGVDSFIGRALVLVLGNTLIIALEGLVVSIQTTRLVLFEFFIRFLRASARSFKPLPQPEAPNSDSSRREP